MKNTLLIAGAVSVALLTSGFANGTKEPKKDLDKAVTQHFSDNKKKAVEDQKKNDTRFGHWFVGYKYGTIGHMVDLGYSFNDTTRLRWQTGGGHTSGKFEFESDRYQGKQRSFTSGLYLDWFPWKESFRLTGGLVYNNSTLRLFLDKPAEAQERKAGQAVGSFVDSAIVNYTPKAFSKYIGIGYDIPQLFNSRFDMTFDFGYMYQGKVKASIETVKHGPLAGFIPGGKAGIDAAILDDARRKGHRSGKANAYPVLMLGLRYAF